MTAVSRILGGLGRVGVITIGFLVTPVLTISDHILLGSILCSLLLCGVLTAFDRLTSS